MTELAPVRPAAVAGSWYPGDARALTREVDTYLSRVDRAALPSFDSLIALIAPHAGLIYSGPVAAWAYEAIRDRPFDLIVLVGPSHFVGFDGVSIVATGAFETPFGLARIDEDCAAALLECAPVVRDYPAAHRREHSLEMQLPFLQRLAPTAPIVPLVMGAQSADTARALGEGLAHVLGSRRALLVASTDLSQYHDAATAARMDGIVLGHVERLDPEALQQSLEDTPEHACGGGPTVAVMRAARALGARDSAVLKYADSGDVSGDKSSVVGYLSAMIGLRHS